jgi:hypothetical protein
MTYTVYCTFALAATKSFTVSRFFSDTALMRAEKPLRMRSVFSYGDKNKGIILAKMIKPAATKA